MGADYQIVQDNAGGGGGGRGYMDWTNIEFTGNSNSFSHLMSRNPVLRTTVRSNGTKTTHTFLLRHLKD